MLLNTAHSGVTRATETRKFRRVIVTSAFRRTFTGYMRGTGPKSTMLLSPTYTD